MVHTAKNLPAMRETQVWSLGREDPLEKEMATHSSILAWRIPWTKESGGLQSRRSQTVGQDWSDQWPLLLYFQEWMGFPGASALKNPPANERNSGSIPGSGRSPVEGNGHPLQYSGKSHEQRSLAEYSPWDRKELDVTERTHTPELLHTFKGKAATRVL